jgi:hypothetical protein
MFYTITKSFTSGHLAGVTLTEVLPFAMALGNHAGIMGTCDYTVTSCERVGA